MPRYTYRADPAVPAFDDGAPLVIFDGMCVLCSSDVQWMMRRDPGGETKFAVVQSPLARALYVHYGLDPERFDTFMVLADGEPHLRWRGVLAALQTLPRPWSWFGHAGRLVPTFLGDAIYDLVQRNRFNWFGKRETCLAPDAAMKARFLETPTASDAAPKSC